ncbi:diguanylate cyclase domain-containing protein [Butyrivibrio sp. JL13D10]|uniref:diguanylate cyclase domain-containing protein n=1 Tax=Butyrivibrio sp. JL13D10 TaxID=3236815 RepID=UPI0038B55CD6
MEIQVWVVQNFYASFMLIIVLIFQSKTAKLKTGRMYSNILKCTLVLILSESIGRVFELQGGKYLTAATIAYGIMFILDPVDILYAVRYLDCWMDDKNEEKRQLFRTAFQILILINAVFVSIDIIFRQKWFFYFENDIYYRGKIYVVRAVVIGAFVLLVGIYSIAFRKNILSEYKNLILVLPALAIIGAFLQVRFGLINATYAGIAMGCLIIYLSFQSNDVNIDYLTGVYNRRGLDLKLQSKIHSRGRNFTAIMMDIDHFKEINDTLGHDEGDKAIKIMADVLIDIFGPDSSVGRFGGDEFCVVSDNINTFEIDSRISNVRKKFKKYGAKRKWPQTVDVSCGYEIYQKDSNMSLEAFSEHIDKLMYTEKEAHHIQSLTNT